MPGSITAFKSTRASAKPALTLKANMSTNAVAASFDALAQTSANVPSRRYMSVWPMLAAGIFVATMPTPASAKKCVEEVVTVRGEPATFKWLARSKARANWRSRIRVTPGLGDPFANWALAEDAEEQCVSQADGTVCRLSGRPCRRF